MPFFSPKKNYLVGLDFPDHPFSLSRSDELDCGKKDKDLWMGNGWASLSGGSERDPGLDDFYQGSLPAN